MLPDFLFCFKISFPSRPRAGLVTVRSTIDSSSFSGLATNTLNVRNLGLDAFRFFFKQRR